MKKSVKIALIIAVLCLVLGIVMVGAACVKIAFDFSNLNTLSFESKSYEVTEEFRNLSIRDIECNVVLAVSGDETCRVIWQETDKITTSVEVKKNTLCITRNDSRRWYERIGISWGNDLTVTVYLPEKSYDSLYVKTVSGDIEIPNNFHFSECELSSTSGDITFSAKVEETLTLKSTSGNIRGENITANSVHLSATSGDLHLTNVSASDMNIESTSGDIFLRNVTVQNETKVTGVSGDIELEALDADTIYLKTVSGDVTGSLTSSKKFTTHTVSGNVHVPPDDPSAGECVIKTTSGNIRITVLS